MFSLSFLSSASCLKYYVDHRTSYSVLHAKMGPLKWVQYIRRLSTIRYLLGCAGRESCSHQNAQQLGAAVHVACSAAAQARA